MSTPQPQRLMCNLLPCAAVLLLTLQAAAADAPPPRSAAPAAPAAAPPASQEARTLPIGLVMERNGGSLMRAEVATHAPLPTTGEDKPDAPPGTFAAISFFSVTAPAPKTYKKHDLVTIIARENSQSTSNGTSKLTKAQDLDSQLNSFIALRPSLEQLRGVSFATTPEIKLQNARDFNTKGEVDRADTFSDRITAEVVDVKPNGTLVLQAVKEIKTDEEDQRMLLTGVCRVADVTADNTVLTTQLFDLELTQTHTGAVNDTTRRGFIPRLLDTFSPF